LGHWTKRNNLKTTDGGLNWQSIRCPEIDQYGIIHFTNEKEGWAIGYNRNLMHSTDGGLTWQKKSYPGPEYGTSHLHGLTFNSTGKGAFLGAFCDLMLTDDNGQTWSTQRFGEDRYIDDHFSSVSITDNDHIWISGQRRITLDKYIGIMLYSSDGGATWEEKHFDSLNPFGRVFFINNQIGWMISTNSTLLHTSDGGRNWEKLNTNTTEAIVDFHFTDEMNGWLIEHLPNVQGGSEHFRIFKTTSDGGKTWKYQNFTVNLNKYYTNLSSLFFINPKIGWAVGSDGAILKTTTGGEPE
jgi:photosystem II stability/assembly factor-like uncharacterized protein